MKGESKRRNNKWKMIRWLERNSERGNQERKISVLYDCVLVKKKGKWEKVEDEEMEEEEKKDRVTV